LRDWLLAAERNVACQAGAVPRGPSFTSLRRMVCSLMTSESGAQARAIWYILKTADCPVTGSTFSSSFFAVGGAGVSEQAVSMARRAMAGKMEGFSIGSKCLFYQWPRGYVTLFTSATQFWWHNVGSRWRWYGLEDLGEGKHNGGSLRSADSAGRHRPEHGRDANHVNHRQHGSGHGAHHHHAFTIHDHHQPHQHTGVGRRPAAHLSQRPRDAGGWNGASRSGNHRNRV